MLKIIELLNMQNPQNNGTISETKLTVKDKLDNINNSIPAALIKLFDPTGITGWYDLYDSASHLMNTPTPQRTNKDYITTVIDIGGVIPLGNTFFDFFKIAKQKKTDAIDSLLKFYSVRGPGFIQDLKQNEAQKKQGGQINYLSYFKSGGIHIKPENKGKFTETKKRTGKSTEELTHSKNPLTRKRAIFAQNAKKWNHK